MINITDYPKLNELKQTKCRLEIPPGWFPLVEEMLETIDTIVEDHDLPKVNYLQIKQKFTLLRTYFNYGDCGDVPMTPFRLEGVKMIRDVVDFYEELSRKICTLTGLPGKQVVIGGFYTVLHESLFKENKRNEQYYTNKGKALDQQSRGF